MNNPPLYLCLNPLPHSYGYEPAEFSQSYLAGLSINSKSFTQYPGRGAVALSGAVAYGIGHAPGLQGLRDAWKIGKISISKALAHGVSRGIIGSLRGGSFKSGFLSGLAGSIAGAYIKGAAFLQKAGTTAQAVANAIVGGIAARAGGGKFANGAISAAFVYLYNEALDKLYNIKTINENIATVKREGFFSWLRKVLPRRFGSYMNFPNDIGDWDYKTRAKYDCSFGGCENFGNVNYGATGAALGIPLELLLRGAGFVSEYFGETYYRESYGHWYDSVHAGSDFGDHKHDRTAVETGYNYYRRNF